MIKMCFRDLFIITSRNHHRYLRYSFATPPYCALLQAGLQAYILYRHGAAECRFQLVVLPLLVHVKGCTGVHPLRVRPYFSSSVSHAWFV